MRVLLISYLFPPFNTIGAVRTGKTAAWLSRWGHDVRVISARDQPLPSDLPLELPPEHVIHTPWLNVNRPIEAALGGRRQVIARGFAAEGRSPWLRRLGGCYRTLLNFPDAQIGWLPFAERAGSRLLRDWRPDVILASSGPITSLLVARRLATRHGIPWVAELRDLWVENHNYQHPPWRRWIESAWEQRTLGAADALVTVSGPLAECLRSKHRQPVAVVLNGYDVSDVQDFDAPDVRSAALRRDGTGPLRIIYTGTVYEKWQDSTPLFEAIRELGEDAAQVRIAFYGRRLDGVLRAAKQSKVETAVEIHEPISHHDALRIQAEADALLLLLWNEPRELGVYTGKLFEYLGARRPILAVGIGHDVAADLVRERRAGHVLNDPRAIAQVLRQWIANKRAGRLAEMLPAVVAEGLSRECQVRKLETVLRDVASSANARARDVPGPHRLARRRQERVS